jgi:hypothetical protein
MRRWIVELRLADHRAHLVPGRQRIADLVAGAAFLRSPHDLVEAVPGTSMRVGALQDWPLLHRRPARRRHRVLEGRVVEQDVGRLAAEFLGHALDRVGGGLAPRDAGAGRAGERHHVDVGMRGHRGAHRRAVAVDEVEHARRHAGVVQHLGEDERVQRRDLARLQHHGAAGGERRRHLAGDLVQRPVPRRDQPQTPIGSRSTSVVPNWRSKA